METPYTTELVKQTDGTWVVLCRAVFMVPESADLTEEMEDVEREAVRQSHLAAATLVRRGLAPS